MSLLRLIGIFLSIVLVTLVFLKLRKHSDNRLDVLMMTVLGIGLASVSLFPSLVNLPAELLSLNNSERGRLLTLLVISSIASWIVLIYERGKSQRLSALMENYIRSVAVNNFFNNAHGIPEGSILIIIPVYNEGENLGLVLSSLPEQIEGRPLSPLVVDDGSTDETAMLCEKLNVLLAQNPVNRGGGAALRVGFDIGRRLKASVIVTMDGDGQHRVDDLPLLISPILENQADLVIGSRLLGEMERYSPIRYWGVVFFSKMISLLLGQKITDPASGFRALNPKVLVECHLAQDQYHTAELIIEASKRKLRIAEQPILIQTRISGESKKGKNIKYALLFLKSILRTWLR